MTTYQITAYGDTADFTSLDAAQAAARACASGPDDPWATTSLRISGDRILDEHGATVGRVIEQDTK